ncbi:hypothetical protein [Microbacterium sp. KNMS]
MARAAITVGGGSTLARTLRKAGVDLKELKPVNRAAAEIAMEQARQDAPVVSGRLRDTLRVGATNRAGVVRAGNNRTSASGVRYAGPVHWGWPGRGIAANPFMTRAARATQNRWVRLYENFTNRILNKVKGI